MSITTPAQPASRPAPARGPSNGLQYAQLGALGLLIVAIVVLGALHDLSQTALVGLLGVLIGHGGAIAIGTAAGSRQGG